MFNLKSKELIIIAGANGSGKTTFANVFLTNKPYKYLNADELAKELNPTKIEDVRLSAGKVFFMELEKYLENNQNILIESTLAGKYVEKLIKKFKLKKYFISIIYVFLDSTDMCIERIRERVFKGGHNVPEEDIIRRYYRSKKNFWNNYRNLVDYWYVVYNAGNRFEEIALGKDNNYSIQDNSTFQKFLTDIE